MLHSFRVTCTGFSWRRVRVAAPVFAQGPAVLVASPPSLPAQDPQAALRAQIELLRQQLEALQQKVAALEAAAGSVRRLPRRRRLPTPPAAAARRRASRCRRRRRRGRAHRIAAGLRQHLGAVEDLQSRHRGDRQLRRRGGARTTSNPLPALQAERSGGQLPGDRRSLRARRLLPRRVARGRSRSRKGFLTFPTLPGGLLMKVGKMKAQFGKVNTMHSHTLPWVDAPLPMQNLLGGDEGLNDSGVSVSKLILNPVLFLEATGEIYNGDNTLFTSYKRSDLTYVGRLRGYRDVTEVDQPRHRHLVRLRPQRRRTPTRRRASFGVDATFRYRPLRRAIYKRFLGRTELFWSRREQPVAQRAGVRRLRQRRLPVRAALVRRRALRLLGSRRRHVAARQERLAAGDLLAERVQPDPRAVPPHVVTPRASRRTRCCSSSCFPSARTARTCSKAADHADHERNHVITDSLAVVASARCCSAPRRRAPR